MEGSEIFFWGALGVVATILGIVLGTLAIGYIQRLPYVYRYVRFRNGRLVINRSKGILPSRNYELIPAVSEAWRETGKTRIPTVEIIMEHPERLDWIREEDGYRISRHDAKEIVAVLRQAKKVGVLELEVEKMNRWERPSE